VLRSLSALFPNSFRTLECQNGRKRNSTPNWRFKTDTKLNFWNTICPNGLLLGWILQFHLKLLKTGSDFLKIWLHLNSKLKACTFNSLKRRNRYNRCSILHVSLSCIEIFISVKTVYSYHFLIKFLQFLIKLWSDTDDMLIKFWPDLLSKLDRK